MLNDCIRIGIREHVTSMKSLSSKAYHQLSRYDLATCYRLTAVSKATGILRNYRKSMRKNSGTKTPYAERPVLVDCYGFRIQGKRPRLTLIPHEHAYIDLNDHTLETIANHAVRSVTLTAGTLSMCYSKDVEETTPRGLVGIDSNLDNITIASSDGYGQRFDLKSHANQGDIQRSQVSS